MYTIFGNNHRNCLSLNPNWSVVQYWTFFTGKEKLRENIQHKLALKHQPKQRRDDYPFSPQLVRIKCVVRGSTHPYGVFSLWEKSVEEVNIHTMWYVGWLGLPGDKKGDVLENRQWRKCLPEKLLLQKTSRWARSIELGRWLLLDRGGRSVE